MNAGQLGAALARGVAARDVKSANYRTCEHTNLPELGLDKDLVDASSPSVKLGIQLLELVDLDTVTDHERRVELAGSNVVVQDFLPVQVNRRLAVTDESNTLLHDGTDVELVAEGRVGGNQSDPTHLSDGSDTLVGCLGHVGLEHQSLLSLVQERLGLVESPTVQGAVQSTGDHLEDLFRYVLDLAEIDRLDALQLAGHFESSGDLVDGDDSLGTLEQGPSNGTLTDRAETPDTDDVALLDASVDDTVVRGGQDVRQVEGCGNHD